MEYAKLGNSDLKVSRVCMGCMGFGDPTNGMHTWILPEAESMDVITKGLTMALTSLTRHRVSERHFRVVSWPCNNGKCHT